MSFLNSIWLWGALAAAGVAVPILIHLLSRYRSRQLDWAAMELLRRAMVIRARRVRMEDLILLLLRCLAAALIALALARPTLTPAAASRLTGEGKAGVVIALDGSYSMAHKPGTLRRFDAALARAREVLATLSPGDPVSLVVIGDKPHVQFRNVGYDAEKFEAALKTLAPLAESLNLDVCLEEVEKFLKEIKSPVRECYLITDGQAVTWNNVSESARRSLKNMRSMATVFFVPVGTDDADNLAITRLEVASGILRPGAVTRYVADARNAGQKTCTNVTVRLFVNNAVKDERVIETIDPGATVRVSLFPRFDKGGTYAIQAQLESLPKYDALSVDNTRYAVACIRDTVNVLCVDGDPSSEPFRSETGFLQAALVPEVMAGGSEISGTTLKVKTITPAALKTSGLTDSDVIMLANVPEVSHEQSVALADFVRGGGGLMVFLGNKINAGLINARMRDRDGSPLLPADLLEQAGEVKDRFAFVGGTSAEPEGSSLSTQLPDHAITGIFATLPQAEWSSIRFYRYFKTAVHKNGRVLLQLALNSDPILLESSLGRGKVLLFTSTADRDWTDLVVHPAYLMLVQQSVTYMTRRALETPAVVPEPLAFELPLQGIPPAVTIRDPAGEETSVRVVDNQGRRAAKLDSTDLPGVYTVKPQASIPEELKMAVNVNPEESSIAVLRGSGLDKALDKLPVRVIQEGRDIQAAVRDSRFGLEMTRIMLLVALGALIAEALLAKWLAGRMPTRVGPRAGGSGSLWRTASASAASRPAGPASGTQDRLQAMEIER